MKENELVPAGPLSVNDIIQVSKMFFESGLFADIKSAAQAMVKIMAGAEVGLPAFQSMSGIHIIAGKPVIGAGLMASRVKSSGKYDYKVIQQDEKACSIEFYRGKEKLGTSTFTLEDAKKAGTKNIDKFPANMLFARAISNGVRYYCPDVFAGPVYTSEEMQQPETLDVTHTELGGEYAPFNDTLEAATTLEQLADIWNAIPQDQQAAHKAKAAEVKQRIKNAQAPATG